MSTTPVKSPELEVVQQLTTTRTKDVQDVIAWSSLFFALLQSICTFFAALDGLRLVIGVASLAVATWASSVLDKLHADKFRIPMIVLALVGSLLNVAILVQIRRLRNRPASQWRQKEVSPDKIRMERMQIILSIATLVLIGIEEYLHFRTHYHL